MIPRLVLLFVLIPFFASGQNKYPPRDDSGKSPALQSFVAELRDIIKSKNSEKLLERIHPKVRFDFDEGVGIEKFRKLWQPEDRHSPLWPVMDRIVGLGGVYVKDRRNPFYDFVFPYVNEVELSDADRYFDVLVVTGKDVNVRERPDLQSKVVGQLTYDIVNHDHDKSPDDDWYFVETTDKKISGYLHSDFAYSPVGYRMFLTQEKGKWMISCLIAGD